MKVLTSAALEHYRTAAIVGQRLGGLHPHTVHVKPDDLAALVDRYTDGLVDEVKIAIAGQCSCHTAGCLHDLIRAAAGDVVALREHAEVLRKTSEEAEAENDRLRAQLVEARGRVDGLLQSKLTYAAEYELKQIARLIDVD